MLPSHPRRIPPQTPTRPRPEPQGRRAGGPPGHEGHARAVRPLEAVDVGGIPVKPVQGRNGQHPWQGKVSRPPSGPT